MKRKFTFLWALAVACLLSFSAQAQYAKGDISANLGISFGLIGYGYGYYSNYSGFLPLSANVEYSINDKFAIGPYAGYYGRTYKYGSGYSDRWSVISFGARGTYHGTALLNDLLDANIAEEKWDIYGTVLLGYENYSWKYDSDFVGNRTTYNSGKVVLGPVLGARYFFSPQFGAFAELGRGVYGVATLGITGKF